MFDHNRELKLIENSTNEKGERSTSDLPVTSVIITFHNEARSTLLRTIVSVLRRSPPRLLKEIVLVDDYSDQPSIGRIMSRLRKVRLVRNDRREGLVRSRLKGAALATGAVLTFLDSHCECSVGWLQPLLRRVQQNPLVLAAPIIDILRLETFEYVPASSKLRGTFGWDLVFRWELIANEANSANSSSTTSNHIVTQPGSNSLDPIAPISTPAIAGGLFSVWKRTFFALGQYDSQMDVWGGENIELSIRAWLCGARLEIIPCSRVGHVFRRQHPYVFPGGSAYVFARNSRRVAETWLDRFRPYFYAAKPGVQLVPTGDLETRLQLKKRLRCRSFAWFIQNVYPDLLNQASSTTDLNAAIGSSAGFTSDITRHTSNLVLTVTQSESERKHEIDARHPLLSRLINTSSSMDEALCSPANVSTCRINIRHDQSGYCLAIQNGRPVLVGCDSDVKLITWLVHNFTRLRHTSGKCLRTRIYDHSQSKAQLTIDSCSSIDSSAPQCWTLLPTNQLAACSAIFCVDSVDRSLQLTYCDPSSSTQQWTALHSWLPSWSSWAAMTNCCFCHAWLTNLQSIGSSFPSQLPQLWSRTIISTHLFRSASSSVHILQLQPCTHKRTQKANQSEFYANHYNN